MLHLISGHGVVHDDHGVPAVQEPVVEQALAVQGYGAFAAVVVVRVPDASAVAEVEPGAFVVACVAGLFAYWVRVVVAFVHVVAYVADNVAAEPQAQHVVQNKC